MNPFDQKIMNEKSSKKSICKFFFIQLICFKKSDHLIVCQLVNITNNFGRSSSQQMAHKIS